MIKIFDDCVISKADVWANRILVFWQNILLKLGEHLFWFPNDAETIHATCSAINNKKQRSKTKKNIWIGKPEEPDSFLKTSNYHISPVHVVLVSLLVDQLSGLFLIFFGRPKKNLSGIRSFCSLSWIFCPVFFKKWEIDRTIGWPRDWPKPHF